MSALMRKSWLQSIPVLVLLGIMAGAIGGLGIGLIQMKSSSTATTAK